MKAAEGGHLKKVEDRGDGIINPFSTVIFNTVFENHRKSLIQHCERSELRLHFEWTKAHEKCQKWSILGSF